MTVNTDFSLPLYGDPLNFVLAPKGDFGHPWDKFLSEEEVHSAACQRQGTAACWMTLREGFSAVTFGFLICEMGTGKISMAGVALTMDRVRQINCLAQSAL